MKKIINGKMYNTETAKEIGSWSNNRSYSDFSYCEETLYLKKTGEYFLFGEGGPMTRYAERCGDMLCDGSEIHPMTEEQAKRWAEQRLDADEYIAAFGEPEE